MPTHGDTLSRRTRRAHPSTSGQDSRATTKGSSRSDSAIGNVGIRRSGGTRRPAGAALNMGPEQRADGNAPGLEREDGRPGKFRPTHDFDGFRRVYCILTPRVFGSREIESDFLLVGRKGSRFGHDTLVDGMLKDGLWDVYNDFGMGMCAELCAVNYSISREEQDAYAIQSNERGIAARDSGAFTWEIAPVEVSVGRGRPSMIIEKDESLEKFDPVKLRKLRPSFKENGGTVTAGNASSISDGAAALVLVSGQKALELGLQVIAKIRGYADSAQAPELFTTTPALAIPKAILSAGLDASQVDYYEINEAFSVVALANQKLLSLPSEKVNVHGGAVSLGHPLGCSGARILVTLLGVLRHRNGKVGVAGVCNGGGGASALVLELV